MSATQVLAPSSVSDFQTTGEGVDLPITLTSGHKVYAIVGVNSNSIIPTVTQRNGSTVINTFERVASNPGGGQALYIYELDATSGGDRLFVSTSSPVNIDAHFFVYTGMKPGVSFDKTASSTGLSGTSRSTGMTPTLAQNEEVALAALYMNGNFTVSATPWNNGYTLGPVTSRVFTGYKHTADATSTGSTGTLSSATARFMSGIVATFRADTSNLFTDSDVVSLSDGTGAPEINLGDPDSTLILDETDVWDENEAQPTTFEFDADEGLIEEGYDWVEDAALTIIWSQSDTLAFSDVATPGFEQTIPSDTDTITLIDSDGTLYLVYSPPRVDPYPNTVNRLDPTWRPLQRQLWRHFAHDTRGRNIYLLADDTATDTRPVDPATIRRMLHAGHVHVVSAAEYEILRVGGFT